MSRVMSIYVNFRNRFVNYRNIFIVDTIGKYVKGVNEIVNYAKGPKLTPKCKWYNAFSRLSILSTTNLLKTFICKTYMNSVHISHNTRARVRISRIRVFKKTW